jgi:DNA-binding transcriptional ArsR family regulator
MSPVTNIRRSRSGSGRAPARRTAPAAAAEPAWTFLTNHSHVLVCLVADPDATVEAVARRVGITERSARRIIGELEAARYLSRERVGRRNRYRFDPAMPLRHAVERHRTVGALLDLLQGSEP